MSFLVFDDTLDSWQIMAAMNSTLSRSSASDNGGIGRNASIQLHRKLHAAAENELSRIGVKVIGFNAMSG